MQHAHFVLVGVALNAAIKALCEPLILSQEV